MASSKTTSLISWPNCVTLSLFTNSNSTLRVIHDFISKTRFVVYLSAVTQSHRVVQEITILMNGKPNYDAAISLEAKGIIWKM